MQTVDLDVDEDVEHLDAARLVYGYYKEGTIKEDCLFVNKIFQMIMYF